MSPDTANSNFLCRPCCGLNLYDYAKEGQTWCVVGMNWKILNFARNQGITSVARETLICFLFRLVVSVAGVKHKDMSWVM